jgi:hypothetical protein
MDYYYDEDHQTASFHDGGHTMRPHGGSSWDFHDVTPGAASGEPAAAMRPRPERPRPSRHSSLPQTLFGGGSSSLFGSGMSEEEASIPAVAVTHYQPEESQPPLSTLAGPSTRDGRAEDPVRLLPRVEKDADDPTTPPSSSREGIGRQQSTTLTTLSRLFAVQAPTSTESSRQPSYIHPQRQPSSTYTRNLQTTDVAGLPHHLYTRGLLEGRHSDIAVNAFGHQYKLHRLILDRAPFFTSALSEPWPEANAKEITVHPEDIDASITQHSFELALKRLYGCSNLHEEDGNAVGLFATGCWLQMQDLIESSIESMLRQMTPETLSPLIKLVTSNYYGRAGDKILASAKAMLCRDGWRMPIRFWDGIPGDIIREIVGGDGFFIDGEWDRWVLAKRILDRRLKARAIEAGMTEPGSRRKVRKAPDTVSLMAVRFDGVYRRNSVARGMSDALSQYITFYTHPDIEPVLVLLDEGIHYIHLEFEQLQFIRRARDCLGLPIMPEKVISTALWQQMELRQKVVNAREAEMELDLSYNCTDDSVTLGAGRDTTMSITTPSSPPDVDKGKRKVSEKQDDADFEDLDSGSWDGNGKPRKFWIPASDCNIVMGGNADPVIATSNSTTLQRHANRISATLQPEDIQWVADFTAITSQPRAPLSLGPDGVERIEAPAEIRYTHFPPFRFAAEFPNPRLLKDKKRVYSRTVFYAGSQWNIYIQKVATTRNKQLGVYLHRARDRDTEEAIAGTAGLSQGSVVERIGGLEREMILRSERRERRQRRRREHDAHEGDEAESSGSAGDHEATPAPSTTAASAITPSTTDAGSQRSSTMRSLLSHSSRDRGLPTRRPLDNSNARAGQTDIASSSSPSTATFPDPYLLTPSSDSEDSDTDSDSETERFDLATRCRPSTHVPTLPPYVDARPTIKTYFKIYSPSRGGRMLSVYESAPDKFNFSQSWGWKSSTLMLDEGLLGEGDEDTPAVIPLTAGGDDIAEPAGPGGLGAGAPPATTAGAKVSGRGGVGMKGKGDGKLRFMVVIGNI